MHTCVHTCVHAGNRHGVRQRARWRERNGTGRREREDQEEGPCPYSWGWAIWGKPILAACLHTGAASGTMGGYKWARPRYEREAAYGAPLLIGAH